MAGAWEPLAKVCAAEEDEDDVEEDDPPDVPPPSIAPTAADVEGLLTPAAEAPLGPAVAAAPLLPLLLSGTLPDLEARRLLKAQEKKKRNEIKHKFVKPRLSQRLFPHFIFIYLFFYLFIYLINN